MYVCEPNTCIVPEEVGSLHVDAGNLNLDPFQEQKVLLITKTTPQTQNSYASIYEPFMSTLQEGDSMGDLRNRGYNDL